MQELWFNVNVEYGDTDEFNALPESRSKTPEQETGTGYLVPDTTGNYRLDNFELMMDLESQDAVFWSSKGSYHVEGTEGCSPSKITSAGAAPQAGADSARQTIPTRRRPPIWTRRYGTLPGGAALPQYEHGKWRTAMANGRYRLIV